MPLVLNSSSISGLAAVGGLSSPQTGSVLQVVQGSTATQSGTNSSSFAATALNASITPSSATSKILILVSITDAYQTTANHTTSFTVYRNSTNLAPTGSGSNQSLGMFYTTIANSQFNVNMSHLDSPATTSAITYTVYFNVSGGFGQINANGQTSFIQLLEIAG